MRNTSLFLSENESGRFAESRNGDTMRDIPIRGVQWLALPGCCGTRGGHERLFAVCLKEGGIIADPEELYDVAEGVGLDRREVETALREGTYSHRLVSALTQARGEGISTVSTFVVNSNQVITGAQSLERLRFLLSGGAA